MSKRVRIRVGIFLALLVLAIVLPPFINVGRFRVRIADSISRALGRQVTIGSVELRLVPEPGFALQNFVVGDDPALSAEPMLRAEEVTASLRLASLWRGRLEIARLSLSYPSLNLVRSPDGRFNMESLLMRASQTPSAPTTASRAEARPRFPYIEAAGARINFKSGLEKKVFSFTDADFSLWSPGEGEWRMRLEGRPFRTDMPVNDTGTLTMEASFRRASKLSETPMRIRLSLDNAQMGQLTKLLYGRDRGWRGGIQVNAQASGKPSNLALVVEGEVADFRRHDIFGGDNIRLRTRCTGTLSTVREDIRDVACQVPLGNGTVEVRGNINNLFQADYDLSVTAKKVPLGAAVTIAKHAKRDLPDDLSASGTVDAAFSFRHAEDQFTAQGGGSTQAFALISNVLQKDLAIGRVEFAFQRAPVEISRARRSKRNAVVKSVDTRLEVLPFPVAMGGALPVAASAWISKEEYYLDAKGDADLQRLLQVGRALGLPTPKLAATGTTRIDLKIAGKWQGFAVPQPAGSLQLRNVRMELPGVGAPVLIGSGTARIGPERLLLHDINASVASINLSGSVVMPRLCAPDEVCPVGFSLRTDRLDTDQLNLLLNPRTRKRPWYRLLTSREVEQSVLENLRASGTISASRLKLRGLVAQGVSAKLELRDNVAEFTNLRGEVYGGTHVGTLTADFSGTKPVYKGSGRLQKVAMAQVATAMEDGWATGTVHATYEFNTGGWSTPELIASAEGSADFTWSDGTLKHVALTGREEPLRFTAYSGRLLMQNGVLTFHESKLHAPGGIYEVSGKASPDLTLEFTLTDSNGVGYKITGSLMNPQVAALPEKQASAPLNQ